MGTRRDVHVTVHFFDVDHFRLSHFDSLCFGNDVII